MKLKYIETDRCSECGCNTIVRESLETSTLLKEVREHCHGGNWETREFLCGKEIKFIPNFSQETQGGRCTLSDKHKKLLKKVEKWEKKTEEFSKSIPDEIKQWAHLSL